MAIYRKVHTTFWNDPYIESLTPEKKYFYLYLLTNEKTRQCGIYEISIRQMAFDTGYNNETVERLVQFFQDDDKVLFSKATNEIAIKNWRKHNDDTSPKVKACINKELMLVKAKELREYLGYEAPHGTKFNPNYRVSETLRQEVFTYHGNICMKCKTANNLQIDHVIPRSIGGASIRENLRPLCHSCNSSRPVVGQDLIKDVESDGYSYENLCELMNIKPYAYSMRTYPQQEQEKEQEEEQTEAAEIFSFEEFWNRYPVKVAKPKCQSIYNRLSKKDQESIKNSIDDFISFKPFATYSHPNPQTYLNQKRWLDELPVKRKVNAPAPGFSTYTKPKLATK